LKGFDNLNESSHYIEFIENYLNMKISYISYGFERASIVSR
jgi:adenylosuccinate synthase